MALVELPRRAVAGRDEVVSLGVVQELWVSSPPQQPPRVWRRWLLLHRSGHRAPLGNVTRDSAITA